MKTDYEKKSKFKFLAILSGYPCVDPENFSRVGGGAEG